MKRKTHLCLAIGCSSLLIAMNGVVKSAPQAQLADSQKVIVELSTEVNTQSIERIGRTDFYQTDMATARELRDGGATISISTPLPYLSTLIANDPFEPQDYLDLLGAETFWDESTGDSGITVAVIDSGFAFDHEDLDGRWYESAGEAGGLPGNGLDDDSNGFIDDLSGWDFAYDDNDPSAGTVDQDGEGTGHGTAVAGLIGATGNNNTGIASLNWQAKLLPLQVFDDDGSAKSWLERLRPGYRQPY
jgi:subtilisin family serine protease